MHVYQRVRKDFGRQCNFSDRSAKVGNLPTTRWRACVGGCVGGMNAALLETELSLQCLSLRRYVCEGVCWVCGRG